MVGVGGVGSLAHLCLGSCWGGERRGAGGFVGRSFREEGLAWGKSDGMGRWSVLTVVTSWSEALLRGGWGFRAYRSFLRAWVGKGVFVYARAVGTSCAPVLREGLGGNWNNFL